MYVCIYNKYSNVNLCFATAGSRGIYGRAASRRFVPCSNTSFHAKNCAGQVIDLTHINNVYVSISTIQSQHPNILYSALSIFEQSWKFFSKGMN